MKSFVFISVLAFGILNLTANAQVTNVPGAKYREFVANINIASGEVKNVLVQVNTDLRVDRFGDPEIPSHGFFNYTVTGSVVEGEQTCAFEELLTQGDAQQESLDSILKSHRDRSGSIKLCSGLSIETVSIRSLLVDSALMIGLKAPGLSKKIGTGSITSSGLKTVPTPSYDD